MQKELYDQIQKDYSDYKIMVNKDYRELEELENNPIVKRYKYLLQLKDDIARTNFYDGKNPDFICEVINRYGKGLITETLNIWVWFLDISVRKYEEIFNKTLDGMNKDSMISVYIDIENSKIVKVIPLEQKDIFERENRVVKGNMSIYDASDRYYNTRYKFFKLYIDEGKDVAIDAMLESELSENIKKFNNILKRYYNGEFGENHKTLHEILVKANEEDLLDRLSMEELDYLINHSTGFVRMMFVEIKNKRNESNITLSLNKEK